MIIGFTMAGQCIFVEWILLLLLFSCCFFGGRAVGVGRGGGGVMVVERADKGKVLIQSRWTLSSNMR